MVNNEGENLKTYLEEGRFPTPGDHTKIVRLGSTLGMLIMQKHLAVRKLGVTGTVLDWVPGHGGDVWWVRHDGLSAIGAYGVDEMAQIEPSTSDIVPGNE